jgi:hypothetical protein
MPGGVVVVDVVVSVVLVVIVVVRLVDSLVVVVGGSVVVVGSVVVGSVVVGSVVVGSVVDGGGLDGGELLPQCSALPLLPVLPQLPLSGFPPTPALSVSVTGLPVVGFSAVFVAVPVLPPGSVFGAVSGSSSECVPGTSGDAEGSASANAPPRPHRNRPDATRQADAAPCTREPTSSPPFKASTAGYSIDPAILAQPWETVLLWS